MNRRLILALLLGLLALSVAYAFWYSPRQERVATSPARRQKASAGKTATTEEMHRVRLDLLERQREPFPGVRRNLFGPLFAPPSPPRPSLPPPPPPPPPAPVVVPPDTSDVPLRQELARFVFLGFLEKGREKTVFLTDASGGIFVVRQGDSFGSQRQFRVQEVMPDKMVVRQGEDPRPIVISLVDQAPLAPARPAAAAGRPVRMPVLPYRPPVQVTPEDQPSRETDVPVLQPDSAPPSRPERASLPGRPQPAVEGEEGVMRRLPASDFNNLFSNGTSMPKEERVDNENALPDEVPQ